MEDPFYSVKRQVQESLRSANVQIDAWRAANSKNNVDAAKNIASTLEETLSEISDLVDDLEQTIQIVESNRGRYFSIDDNELMSRKSFVASSKGSVTMIRTEITKKQNDHTRLLPQKKTQRTKLEEVIREDNDDFIAAATQRIHQTQQHQDHKLGEVHKDVQELTQIAVSLRNGLEDEERAIETLENETEEADSQMKKAIKQVEELLDKAGEGCSWGIIGVLVVLLVILIVVVFEM